MGSFPEPKLIGWFYATRPLGGGDSHDKRILRGKVGLHSARGYGGTVKGRRTTPHIVQSALFPSY